MRTPRWSSRFAGGSTACRWRSSSPHRASRCSALKALPPAWTTAYGCQERSAEQPCRGTGPCGPSSTGATVCSARTSNDSSARSACSPAALPARRPRPSPWMRQHAGTDAIDRLADLVAKSLVVADVSGARPRFRLLDTTRAYAIDKLDASGERERLARRHAEYYRSLFECAEGEAAARPADEWLADYAREIDNLRAALDWAFSPGGDASIGVALTAAAVPLWMQLSTGRGMR